MAEHTTADQWALPYPDLDEPADPPTDIQQLAVAVAAQLTNIIVNFAPPVGAIFAWGAAAAPTHYLMCDGSSKLRADFPALFVAIGTAHGSADGTHFNIPDMRGRTIVHPDGSAGRLAANDAFGQAGGEEKHALTVGEIPQGIPVSDSGIFASPGGSPGGNNLPYIPPSTGSWTNVKSGVDPATNGGIINQSNPHNNMQPYLVLPYIIRAE